MENSFHHLSTYYYSGTTTRCSFWGPFLHSVIMPKLDWCHVASKTQVYLKSKSRNIFSCHRLGSAPSPPRRDFIEQITIVVKSQVSTVSQTFSTLSSNTNKFLLSSVLLELSKLYLVKVNLFCLF